jgi:hypothetical protein
MSLNMYKLPLCLVDGVSFTLDHAPEVKITVKMPIAANRGFALDWAKKLPIKDGQITANPFEVIEAQQESFFSTQILSIEGANSDKFFDEYPTARDEIWRKVQDELPKYEQKLEDEIKN